MFQVNAEESRGIAEDESLILDDDDSSNFFPYRYGAEPRKIKFSHRCPNEHSVLGLEVITPACLTEVCNDRCPVRRIDISDRSGQLCVEQTYT